MCCVTPNKERQKKNNCWLGGSLSRLFRKQQKDRKVFFLWKLQEFQGFAENCCSRSLLAEPYYHILKFSPNSE